MSKFAIDMGHCLYGSDTGAQGCGGREELRTREIGHVLIAKLEANGHQCLDVTCDSASSLNAALAYRVNKANAWKADYYVSIHLNANDDISANGTETYTSKGCSSTSTDMANRIHAQMVSLGLRNRGVKREDFYVLRWTNMPAVLVETCFITSPTDMGKYSANAFAEKICIGLIGSGSSASGSYTPSGSGNTSGNTNSEIQSRKEFLGGRCKEVQTMLIALGYSCGAAGADGDFGQGTYNALIKFQKDNGLTQDGYCGPNTTSKLEAAYKAKTSSNSTPGISLVTCKSVAEQYGVSELQKMLIALGYSCGAAGADGDFGQGTRNAVEAFQRQQGLSVDGCPGPNTQAKVRTVYEGKQNQSSNSGAAAQAAIYGVSTLQTHLIALGFSCGVSGVDGSFGNGTQEAVKSFQRVYGLDIDGIPGPNTRAKLKTAYNGKLTVGDRQNVIKIQSLLSILGYGVSIDGSFGPASLNAVEAFQRQQGLSVDGCPGPNTIAKLKSIACPIVSVSTRYNVRTASVKFIQRKIGVTDDGDFGNNSKAALVIFQRNHGLSADGSCGPATWDVILVA